MIRLQWEELGVDQEEHYLVNAIRQHLLTPTQKKELFDRDISIEDVLNGRTTGEHSGFVRQLFADWNAKLGWTEFGY